MDSEPISMTSRDINFDELPERGKASSEQLAAFSASNGMQYSDENTKLWKSRHIKDDISFPQDVSDGLPGLGSVYKDIIYCEIQGFPAVIYTSLNLFGWKATTTITCIFPEFLPTLIIKPKKHGSPMLDLGLINASKDRPIRELTLEGNFSRQFKVYSDGEYAIEALTILGPDFMEQLQQHVSDYNIVIFRNSLSINFKHKATKPFYIHIFDTANKIVAPITKEIMGLNVLALNDKKGIQESIRVDPGKRRNQKSLLIGLIVITALTIGWTVKTGSLMGYIVLIVCSYLWALAGFLAFVELKSRRPNKSQRVNAKKT